MLVVVVVVVCVCVCVVVGVSQLDQAMYVPNLLTNPQGANQSSVFTANLYFFSISTTEADR